MEIQAAAFFEGSKRGYDEGYAQAVKDCVLWLEGQLEPTLARQLRDRYGRLPCGGC